MPIKNLPNNIEAEESVLGACFLSKYALQKACENLTADSFYDEKNGKIFAAMNALVEEKTPVIKQISGLNYYGLNSTFGITLQNIDNINALT